MRGWQWRRARTVLAVLATGGVSDVLQAESSSTAASPSTLGSGVHSELLVQTVHTWDGDLLPPYARGQPQISVLKYEIPPGARLPLHYHEHANAGVLLSGSLTVHSEDGAVTRLGPGEVLVELVGTPHYGVNEGDQTTVVVVFYAGEQGRPLTRLVDAPDLHPPMAH